jgi:hypothetical protein
MRLKFSTYIFIISLAVIFTGRITVAQTSKTQLIRDGWLIKSIPGTITTADANNVYYFQFTEDVNHPGGKIPARTKMPLLYSSTLQALVADADEHTDRTYRLWARVTKYKNNNYLFPNHFIRLLSRQAEEETEDSGSTKPEPGLNADDLEIPAQVLEIINSQRPINRIQPQSPTQQIKQTQPDYLIVNKVGFIKQENQIWIFSPDNIGRNVQSNSFELLPCQALEQAEKFLNSSPDSIRLRISAIATTYKNKKYLLLQRVIRQYDHGNFIK